MPRDLAGLDLPERLAAELEVVALLVDRPAAAALDQDAVLDAADQVVERELRRRPAASDTLGMRGNGTLPQLSACRQPCERSCADQRRQLARGLPVDEHAVPDQVPALRRARLRRRSRRSRARRAACGRRRSCTMRRAELQLAGLVRREEPGAGVVRLPSPARDRARWSGRPIRGSSGTGARVQHQVVLAGHDRLRLRASPPPLRRRVAASCSQGIARCTRSRSTSGRAGVRRVWKSPASRSTAVAVSIG